MGRKATFNDKVYKRATPGAGLEPGTVDWELRQRQNRREDRAFRMMMEEQVAMEPKGIFRVWDAIANFFRTQRW
jgi:hypothetical protein